MSTIGVTGAISRSDNKRMTEHAVLYYKEIRKRTTDVAAITANTRFTIADVDIVKQHLFFNKYDLGGNEPERFSPSYDIAVSWQRLIEGNHIQEMDIALLNHELLEYSYMQAGKDFFEAHRLAEKEYNYAGYVKELDLAEGVR
ncbi:MAG: hypothetical protein LBS51_02670 [Oscillospiraceae bacterium]|jgi:hypothetical protein|nr:hypothetical protein [Oscillospiraceae bacterium]